MHNVSIKATKNFELAHNLAPYNGACANLHGHSYKVSVEVVGPQDDLGMIFDFSILKQLMDRIIPDHAYMYDADTEDQFTIDLVNVLRKHNKKVVAYSGQTTAEHNAQQWAEELQETIDHEDDRYKVKSVEVFETEKNCAIWRNHNV